MNKAYNPPHLRGRSGGTTQYKGNIKQNIEKNEDSEKFGGLEKRKMNKWNVDISILKQESKKNNRYNKYGKVINYEYFNIPPEQSANMDKLQEGERIFSELENLYQKISNELTILRALKTEFDDKKKKSKKPDINLYKRLNDDVKFLQSHITRAMELKERLIHPVWLLTCNLPAGMCMMEWERLNNSSSWALIDYTKKYSVKYNNRSATIYSITDKQEMEKDITEIIKEFDTFAKKISKIKI